MRNFGYVLLAIFLSGCGATYTYDNDAVIGEDFDKWAESGFQDIYIGPDYEDPFYFEYPIGASFTEHDNSISYGNCDFFYGTEYEIPVGLNFNEKKGDGVTYKAGFDGEDFVFYIGVVDEYDFGFWTEAIDDVSGCTGFINRMTESFTDSVFYNGENYSFTVPDGFKVENLFDMNMVVLKKWVEAEEMVNEEGEDDFIGGYAVEFSVFENENLMGFEDLNAYVAHYYPGYNLEFPSEGCVCVDEMAGDNAFRHFLKMSDDGDYIYEAQLKVPTFHYGAYSEMFDEFSKSIIFE